VHRHGGNSESNLKCGFLELACGLSEMRLNLPEGRHQPSSEVVASKSYEELSTAVRSTNIVEELTELLRNKLQSYGVGVETAFLADFAKCTTIRMYGETPPGQLPPTAYSEEPS